VMRMRFKADIGEMNIAACSSRADRTARRPGKPSPGPGPRPSTFATRCQRSTI
jgi:hypothetical protein